MLKLLLHDIHSELYIRGERVHAFLKLSLIKGNIEGFRSFSLMLPHFLLYFKLCLQLNEKYQVKEIPLREYRCPKRVTIIYEMWVLQSLHLFLDVLFSPLCIIGRSVSQSCGRVLAPPPIPHDEAIACKGSHSSRSDDPKGARLNELSRAEKSDT